MRSMSALYISRRAAALNAAIAPGPSPNSVALRGSPSSCSSML